jgi:hypothetical protein
MTAANPLRYYLDILNEIQSPEEMHTTDEPSSMAGLPKKYQDWAKENPGKKLALDLFPPTAIPTSVADTAANLAQGQFGDAAVSAIGIIPLVKPLTKFARLGKSDTELAVRDAAVKSAKGAYATDAAIDTGQNTAQAKQNYDQEQEKAAELEKQRLTQLAGLSDTGAQLPPSK